MKQNNGKEKRKRLFLIASETEEERARMQENWICDDFNEEDYT
jgi:hypothetical protein